MVRDITVNRLSPASSEKAEWDKILAYTYVPGNVSFLLDIGCNEGNLTAGFRNKARKVYGIDPDVEAVKLGKIRHPGIDLRIGVAENLPFSDSMFDVVTMMDVLEHVDDEERTIDEIYRVLKKRGLLILSAPHNGVFSFLDPLNLKVKFPRLAGLFYKVTGKESHYVKLYFQKNPEYKKKDPYALLAERPELITHRHYSLQQIEQFLGNRFTIEKVHRGGFLILPLCELILSLTKKIFNFDLAFLLKLMAWEQRISFGTFAHKILVRARKR